MQKLNWLLFSFIGRLSRKTFWLTQLAFFVLTIVLIQFFCESELLAIGQDFQNLLNFAAQAPSDQELAIQIDAFKKSPEFTALITFVWKLNILFLFPKLAIDIKRYHDLDKSWYWVLIQLIPLVGGIIYLIQAGCLAGIQGENRFGMPEGYVGKPHEDSNIFNA